MEDRVHDELGRLVDGYIPSPRLPERIETRTRQRATNRRRATVGAVAVLVVAVGSVALTSRGRSGTTVASGSPPAPNGAAPAAATVVPAAAPPPSFLAAVGAGNEQAAVIDTASGHVVRPINAAPPGQELWAISPDGRTLYTPNQHGSGCGRSYQAIDIASGVSRGPAFTELANLTLVAPSPNGQTVAYTASCGTPAGVADVYIRRPNGSTTSLPSGGPVIHLSWSHDGKMLAFGRFDAHNRADSLQVWTIEPSSVTGPYLISAPDAGCSLALPRFAGNGLFAVEQCPSTPAQISAPVKLRLVLLDPTTGSEKRSWALASAPSAMLADLAVDPTGGWALYSLGTSTVNGQVSLLDLGPATANSRVLLNDTFEVAWLPTTAGP